LEFDRNFLPGVHVVELAHTGAHIAFDGFHRMWKWLSMMQKAWQLKSWQTWPKSQQLLAVTIIQIDRLSPREVT
jgi:hypothetical protein